MTDKITIERVTLERLVRWIGGSRAIIETDLFNDLRAALAAQPAEPVAWLWRLNHSGKAFFMVADSTLREVLTDAFPVYAAPPDPAAVPPGWSIRRKDKLPFKSIEIVAPTGHAAIVDSTTRNPENILYMLADTLLTAAGDKP